MQERENHYTPIDVGFERSNEGKESLLKAGFTDEQVNALRNDIWRQFLLMEDTLIPAWFRRIMIESSNEDLRPGCAADIARGIIRNHALEMINARDAQEENPMPDGMQESEGIEKVDRYIGKMEKALMEVDETMNILLRISDLHVSCEIMSNAMNSHDGISDEFELKKCKDLCSIRMKSVLGNFMNSQIPPIVDNEEFNRENDEEKKEMEDMYYSMVRRKIDAMTKIGDIGASEAYNEAANALKRRMSDFCIEWNRADSDDSD